MDKAEDRLSTRIDLSREYRDEDFDTKFLKDVNTLPRTFRAAAVSTWVHVIPKDAVVHRENRTILFSRGVLDGILEVFSRYKNPIPVDYDHNSELSKLRSTPTEIAGYCTGLGIVGDEMYARLLLNQHAIDEIRQGHYAFTSPVLNYNAIDRKTKQRNPVEMTKIALTPDPAIDGQDAINLSRESKDMFEKKGLENKPDEGIEEPRKGDTTEDAPTPPAVANPLQKLAEASGIPVESIGQVIDERLDALVAVLKGETMSGGCAGMSDAQRAAVAIAKEKKGDLTNMSNTPTIDQDKNAILMKQVETLTAENAALKAEKAEKEKVELSRRIDSKVTELLSNGCILPGNEANARRLLESNWEPAVEFLSNLKAVPLGITQAGPDPKDVVPTVEQLSATQLANFRTAKESGVYGRSPDSEIIKAIIAAELAKKQGE